MLFEEEGLRARKLTGGSKSKNPGRLTGGAINEGGGVWQAGMDSYAGQKPFLLLLNLEEQGHPTYMAATANAVCEGRLKEVRVRRTVLRLAQPTLRVILPRGGPSTTAPGSSICTCAAGTNRGTN